MGTTRKSCAEHGMTDTVPVQVPVMAHHFQNGMLMAFDRNGEQVPEYQGYASEHLHSLKTDHPDCRIVSAVWKFGGNAK